MSKNNFVKKLYKDKPKLLLVTIFLWLLIIFLVSYIYILKPRFFSYVSISDRINNLESEIIPEQGLEIPIKFDDLVQKMINSGAIDRDKFIKNYSQQDISREEIEKYLDQNQDQNIVINSDNSNVILGLLWVFGLTNKNLVLENGPINNYEGINTEQFASISGWTLSQGPAINYFNKNNLIDLTPEQQSLVEEISKNIYRPCCDNSTYFPDCNHGMAMFGLIELLVKGNIPTADIYQIALKVNSYWFPSSYLVIGQYFQEKNIIWSDVNAKEILGADFSSISGFNKINREVEPITPELNGGCSV